MANKALVAELNLNIKKFTAQLNRAERRAKAMGQKGGRAGGKALGKGLQGGVAGAMTKIASNIVKTLAVAAAAAGAVFARVIQRSTQEAGQIEAAEMRFNILTGDAEKSNQVLTQLRQTAMRTGITFEAMAGNVGKFMAFGFSPEKAMELNKGILDVGGAVGMTNTDMKLLGVALSQVAAKGVGSMEELRQQIAEKGIPIFKALEEQLGVTGAELNKMIQEGKVSADVVLGLFTDVAKGKGPLKDFAGGADKMATTFQGKIGRMKATWGEFLKRLGLPIIESLKPIMDDILIILEGMLQNAEKWGKSIAATISKMESFTDPMAKMSESLDGFKVAWDAFSSYAGAVFANQIVRGFIVALAGIGTLLLRLINFVGAGFRELLSGDVFEFAGLGLESLMSKIASVLLDAAADFISYLETNLSFGQMFRVFPKGTEGNVRSQADAVRDRADAEAEQALAKLRQTNSNLASADNDFQNVMKGQISQLISNLNDPTNGLDVTGASELQKDLKRILDGLTKRPGEERVELGADNSGSTTPAAAAFSTPMLGGRVDQMNNAIMGRSAFSVIASEAQKATQQRETANTLLREIRDDQRQLTDDGVASLGGSTLTQFR